VLKPDLKFVVLGCRDECTLRLGCVVTSAIGKSRKKLFKFLVSVIPNPPVHLHIKPYSVSSTD
jgi:hypothetical protein